MKEGRRDACSATGFGKGEMIGRRVAGVRRVGMKLLAMPIGVLATVFQTAASWNLVAKPLVMSLLGSQCEYAHLGPRLSSSRERGS